MRKKIVAGNWKMNNSLSEGIQLAEEVNQLVANHRNDDVLIILAPPFIHLSKIAEVVDNKHISVSAQNCASEDSGAYTGEVSAKMIKSTGAEYVIIGHSERRMYYHETNELLAKKVKRTLENDLIPIYCCGEILSERESGKLFEVISKQLNEGLFFLDAEEIKKVVIAYEPVWAIGTGVVATPEQAQDMHAYIRKLLSEKYNEEIADTISVLYGGSCKASNAKELFSQKDVDGGLIGGASLNAKEFFGIINSF